MKLTLTRKSLLTALATVTPAARGTTLPILGHVAIKTRSDAAEFICTNLDLTLRTECEAEVATPGQTTVRASALLALIKSFTGDDTEVRLELVESELVVSVSSSKYKLGVLPFGDFPPTQQKFAATDELSLPQARLRQMLAITSFCASQDEARYVLQGNLLLVNDEIITVATDGRRLAHCSETCDEPASTKRECIIPAASVSELLRLLNASDEGKDRVRVRFTESAAQFILGGTEVTTKLIEGNFPNYRQVMPDTRGIKPVTLAREELLQLLQRVSIIQSESVRMEFNRHSLTLRTLNTKEIIGNAYENMDASGCVKPLKIAFNPKYLIEALKAISDDEVLFYGTDSVSPAVFQVNAKSVNAGWSYVVMPMRNEETPAPAAEAAPESGAANASGAAPVPASQPEATPKKEKGKKAAATPAAEAPPVEVTATAEPVAA